MDNQSERVAKIEPEYTIFVGLGLALIVLGGIDKLLGHPTALGIDFDGIGMIATGTLAIAVAKQFLGRNQEIPVLT